MEYQYLVHERVLGGPRHIKVNKTKMCVRKLIKASHMLTGMCFAAVIMWILLIKIPAMYGPPVPRGTPKALTYTQDIRNKYPGPFHRYKHINGEWKRIYDSTPTRNRSRSQIPKIIHQTWDTDKIPTRFTSWIYSWLRYHKDWEYWFWTPDDVRNMIRMNYPKYSNLYDSYKLALSRADMMRYFVLFSYGGVYSDIDTQALRSLDVLLQKFTCFMSEETHEHAHLLYLRDPPNLMTTIMACRPYHPLFLVAIRALPITKKRYMNDILKATGPLFLDAIYRHYLDVSVDFKHIAILPPEYLLPTYDASQTSHFDRICNQLRQHSPEYMKKTCWRWDKERRMNNAPTEKSFTNHYWVHVAADERTWRKMKTIDIREVVNLHPQRRKQEKQ